MLAFLVFAGGLGYFPDIAVAQDEETVVKVGVLGDLESLNPILAWTEYAWALITLIYEPLVRWNLSGGGDWNVVPGMAENWEWADNGTQVTFHLVENATWHDGTPFTAHDVNWTLFTCTWLGWWVSSQAHTDHHAIRMPDDYTIVINFVDWGLPDIPVWDPIWDLTPYWHMRDPAYNGTPVEVAQEWFMTTIPYLPIFPMHIWDPLTWHHPTFGVNSTGYYGYYLANGTWVDASFWDSYWYDGISWGVLDFSWAEPRIGTGPFTFDEWVPGESVRIEAYEDYHYGRANVDAIEFITYSTVETLTQGVVVGDIDACSTTVTFTELSNFGENVQVVENDFMGYRILFVNQFEEYLNASGMYEGRGPKHNALLDHSVRKAIHQSLNKSRVADVAYLGTARVADSPIHDSLKWHNDEMIEYNYGTAAAIATLEAGGWTLNEQDLWQKEIDGVNETLSFDLKYVAGDPIAFVEAQLLAEDISATGIDVTTVPVEASTFVSDMTEGTWNYDLATDFWTQLGDPNHYIWYLRSISGLNPNNIEIPRIDEIWKLQQITPDFNDRKALVDEFQQIVYNDSSIIPLVYYQDVEIYRSDRWDIRPQDRDWTSGIFSVYNQEVWMNIDVAEATTTPPPGMPIEMIALVAGAAVVVVIVLGVVFLKRR
jgi:ABC-type transport system substrate-binding protein